MSLSLNSLLNLGIKASKNLKIFPYPSAQYLEILKNHDISNNLKKNNLERIWKGFSLIIIYVPFQFFNTRVVQEVREVLDPTPFQWRSVYCYSTAFRRTIFAPFQFRRQNIDPCITLETEQQSKQWDYPDHQSWPRLNYNN